MSLNISNKFQEAVRKDENVNEDNFG